MGRNLGEARFASISGLLFFGLGILQLERISNPATIVVAMFLPPRSVSVVDERSRCRRWNAGWALHLALRLRGARA
jgi:hypothetical protein